MKCNGTDCYYKGVCRYYERKPTPMKKQTPSVCIICHEKIEGYPERDCSGTAICPSCAKKNIDNIEIKDNPEE